MLAECARTLLRCWVWVAVAVVLALGAGAGAYKIVRPGQQSTAQVLLVPSLKQPGVTGATNPFTALGGSMGVVASIVQVAVTDPAVAQRLYTSGARGKYTVEPNLAENAGPVLLVSVDDKSPTMTQHTMTAVIDEIKVQLQQLQLTRGVPPDLLINAVVLTAAVHPSPVHKAQVQNAIMVTVGMLVALIIVILLVERRRQAGSRRRVAPPSRPDDGWGPPHRRQARSRRRVALPSRPDGWGRPQYLDAGRTKAQVDLRADDPGLAEVDQELTDTSITRVFTTADRPR